ncbi:MAG TPA: hypothetical protein VK475_08050 [Pyrinomonadaceae bacterium]|nr:hypothetical protein [Pyrinomonadaceae bacterium]
MNKTKRLLALVLLLAAGLVGGAIGGRISYSVPTQAQREPGKKPDRWEYCSLSKAAVGQSRGGLYWVMYFRDGGAQIVEAEELATERYGPAATIARLGDNGWEMVGEGPLEMRAGGTNAIYFKRLKR